MNIEDPALGLLVREGELDLAVDSSRPNEGRVKGLDTIGGHNNLLKKAGVYKVASPPQNQAVREENQVGKK